MASAGPAVADGGLWRATHMTNDRDFPARRRELIEHLRQRGILDERVLDAIAVVPREEFVPEALLDRTYEDIALPIGLDQTISQPFTVAFMCEALQLNGSETVLEIGTGSGYGACVLSQLATWVETIERLPELAIEARVRIGRLNIRNVRVHVGDGSLGLPVAAPFDAIIATAGAEHCPAAYVRQLADGGRIVIPIGSSPRRQVLMRYTRVRAASVSDRSVAHASGSEGIELSSESLGDFAFVPLIGADAWQGNFALEEPRTE
jgi:protein-L-isoaspartate(D-aspartate) O-methyltransferase